MERLEDIRKRENIFTINQRFLENFASINYKFRHLIYELLYTYTVCDQNEMQKIYGQIKEKIRRIEQLSMQFTTDLGKQLNEPSHYLTLKHFNQYIAIKSKESVDYQQLLSSMPKMTFVNEVFKGLFDINENTIIKDFIKDDYCQTQLKLSLMCKNGNLTEQEQFTLATIKKEVNEQFSHLKMIINEQPRQNKPVTDIIIIIKVPSSFKVILKLTLEDKILKLIRMCVCGFKEIESIAHDGQLRENKLMPINRKMCDIDKSKTKVFKKLNVLFEDKLSFLLKPKYFAIKQMNSLFIFIRFISEYTDLFKKKCHFCDKIAKYSTVEKCFFPPYYRLFDLKSNYFYHEECFSILYNDAA